MNHSSFIVVIHCLLDSLFFIIYRAIMNLELPCLQENCNAFFFFKLLLTFMSAVISISCLIHADLGNSVKYEMFNTSPT